MGTGACAGPCRSVACSDACANAIPAAIVAPRTVHHLWSDPTTAATLEEEAADKRPFATHHWHPGCRVEVLESVSIAREGMGNLVLSVGRAGVMLALTEGGGAEIAFGADELRLSSSQLRRLSRVECISAGTELEVVTAFTATACKSKTDRPLKAGAMVNFISMDERGDFTMKFNDVRVFVYSRHLKHLRYRVPAATPSSPQTEDAACITRVLTETTRDDGSGDVGMVATSSMMPMQAGAWNRQMSHSSSASSLKSSMSSSSVEKEKPKPKGAAGRFLNGIGKRIRVSAFGMPSPMKKLGTLQSMGSFMSHSDAFGSEGAFGSAGSTPKHRSRRASLASAAASTAKALQGLIPKRLSTTMSSLPGKVWASPGKVRRSILATLAPEDATGAPKGPGLVKRIRLKLVKKKKKGDSTVTADSVRGSAASDVDTKEPPAEAPEKREVLEKAPPETAVDAEEPPETAVDAEEPPKTAKRQGKEPDAPDAAAPARPPMVGMTCDEVLKMSDGLHNTYKSKRKSIEKYVEKAERKEKRKEHLIKSGKLQDTLEVVYDKGANLVDPRKAMQNLMKKKKKKDDGIDLSLGVKVGDRVDFRSYQRCLVTQVNPDGRLILQIQNVGEMEASPGDFFPSIEKAVREGATVKTKEEIWASRQKDGDTVIKKGSSGTVAFMNDQKDAQIAFDVGVVWVYPEQFHLLEVKGYTGAELRATAKVVGDRSLLSPRQTSRHRVHKSLAEPKRKPASKGNRDSAPTFEDAIQGFIATDIPTDLPKTLEPRNTASTLRGSTGMDSMSIGPRNTGSTLRGSTGMDSTSMGANSMAMKGVRSMGMGSMSIKSVRSAKSQAPIPGEAPLRNN